MSYIVNYGEHIISNYCKVLNVKRSILPNRSNFSKQIPTMHGSYFTGSKYDEKIIELEISIIAKNKKDYMEKISKLANILNAKEPKQLTIDDEPYKIYKAVIDGSTDLEKRFQNGNATLRFICNNPMAESSYWNTYTPNSDGVIKVESFGTVETQPIIDIDFQNSGCFFQIMNYEGKKVLVGAPKDSTKQDITLSDTIIEETCENTIEFTNLSQVLLDDYRSVTGVAGIGQNGNGIICENYGDVPDDRWGGCALKRNIGIDVDDFEVVVDLVFSSEERNFLPEPPIQQPDYETPPGNSSNPALPPSGQTLGTYKVVNCGGLWINEGPNTNKPIYAMAPNTYIYPTEIVGNWAKHTHKAKYGTYTGYSSIKYLQKISNNNINKNMRASGDEGKMGIVEVYGYDKNGAKLFKIEFVDNNEYFEYLQPSVNIGNTKVLEDSKSSPTPNRENDEFVDSGLYGDFNNFLGSITIRRESNNEGNKLWSAEIKKTSSGKVVKSIATSNSLSNSQFPTGSLNYIGIFIGKRNTAYPCSSMAISNIKVKRLNVKTDDSVEENIKIFERGDHLQLDFINGNIKINNQDALMHLDIGSDFFDIPAGSSQLIFKTDAQDSKVVCGFKDRFI